MSCDNESAHVLAAPILYYIPRSCNTNACLTDGTPARKMKKGCKLQRPAFLLFRSFLSSFSLKLSGPFSTPTKNHFGSTTDIYDSSNIEEHLGEVATELHIICTRLKEDHCYCSPSPTSSSPPTKLTLLRHVPRGCSDALGVRTCRRFPPQA